MINPKLYNELQRVFNTPVNVAAEGDPGSFECPPPAQRRLGRKQKKFVQIENWGETYTLNCPACGDTRQRLCVCHMYGQKIIRPKTKQEYYVGRAYVCHNERCDVSAWLDQMDRAETCTYIETDQNNKPRQFIRTIDKSMDIPEGCVPLIDPEVPDTVLQYLEERRFDPYSLHEQHTVMYMPEGVKYMSGDEEKENQEDRLLIPILQRMRTAGWQARIIGQGKYEHSHKKKYIFPGGSKKGEWIYNMDTALYEVDITLVEGVSDVWRVGSGGIALFGKKPSSVQYQIMSYLWKVAGSCVICLDKDAQKEAKKVHEHLLKMKTFPDGISVLVLDKGDPADYNPREISQLLQEARNAATSERIQN